MFRLCVAVNNKSDWVVVETSPDVTPFFVKMIIKILAVGHGKLFLLKLWYIVTHTIIIKYVMEIYSGTVVSFPDPLPSPL